MNVRKSAMCVMMLFAMMMVFHAVADDSPKDGVASEKLACETNLCEKIGQLTEKAGSSANCRKPFCPAATHPNTAGHFGKPRCRVGTPPLPGCIRRSALQSIIP